MHAVFVAERDELHANEVLQGHEFEAFSLLGFAQFGRFFDRVRNGLFSCPEHMHRITHFGIRSVKEDIHGTRFAERGDTSMDEPGGFESCAGFFRVFATEQDIHVTRVSHRAFIHTRNPSCDRTFTSHSISNSEFCQCHHRTFETLPHAVDAFCHALPGYGLKSDCGAHGEQSSRVAEIRQLG